METNIYVSDRKYTFESKQPRKRHWHNYGLPFWSTDTSDAIGLMCSL